MDTPTQFESAIQLFDRIGVEVRRDHLGGSGGGLCVVQGRRIVLIDLDVDLETRLECCLRALAECPELEGLYVPPALRQRIERLPP